MLNFIDLFAGAGGLSEGFIRAGYTHLAHIEMEKYACETLKTRAAFHWLKNQNKLFVYKRYLYGKQEYATLPSELQNQNKKYSFLNRFQVVDPVCYHVVVAHIAMDGHFYIYPSFEQIFSITIREAARLQSFHNDYYFEGSRSAAFNNLKLIA